MRILFIGASGFVGRHALAAARQAGWEALGTQSGRRHPDLLTFDLLTDRIADRLPADWRAGRHPAWGIVCASVRQVDECFRNRERSHRINVEGTVRLIEDLLALGIRPLFISTSWVFDGVEGYYVETHPRGAVCEYGRQKAEVETWLEREHPDLPVLRLDKIVGDDPAEDHLFTEWLGWLQAGRPLQCIAGQIMSPTFVKDIGPAILSACTRSLTGLYHAANPEFFTRDELARQFLAILGRPGEIVCRPQEDFHFADPRPQKTYLDASKFLAATGMRFTTMRAVIRAFAGRIPAP